MNPSWRDSAEQSVKLANQAAEPRDTAGGKHTKVWYTKAEVKFEHPAKGDDSCGGCVHFRGPNKCAIVQGFIRRTDWCDKYEARKAR